MSDETTKLSKRRQKNIQKTVEWEANATNPVGITCPLNKCRDLLSLATNSVDIFNDVLGNFESLKRLEKNGNLQKFARRILDAGMCAWLFVLLYAGPHETTAKLLEELVGAFSAGRNLPKGFSIRSARGKAFIPPEEYKLVLKACRESKRLFLFLSGKLIIEPLQSRDPVWLLGLKLLHDDDINQAALACNSLLYEIEINPKRMLLFQELSTMIDAFRLRILSFSPNYVDLNSCKSLLQSTTTTLQRSRRKFRDLLMEIARVDNEELLDVPLDHFLKEHDNLRIAYHARQKAQKAKDETQIKFDNLCGAFDVLFSCIRNLGILVSRAIAMYTGLNIDTTSLLRIEPDSVIPATVESSAHIYPILFGGNSTSPDNNLSQKEAVISLIIHQIPWNTMASLAHLEREVSGTISLRLVAATVAKLSDTLQARLGPWCRRALHDLVQKPRWYPVTESIPEATKDLEEVINPNMAQGLMSVLEEDTESPPKWRYFMRELSLDTRISTALVYWCNRGNKSMVRRTLSWEEVRNGVTQTEKYLWRSIIEQAVEKSTITEDAEKYYAKIDPTRIMREMSRMAMAKSMRDLDPDGDSDSDSDSNSDSDSENNNSEDGDDCSSHEEDDLINESDEVLRYYDAEEEEMDITVNARHSAAFEDLLQDEFVISILHASATEIPDLDAPDFDLYKDAKNLSIGTFECSKYLHNELYDHMRKLLVATLEGPADNISHRFIHPLHLVSLFVQHDDKDNTTAPALCRLEVKHWETIVQQCTHIRRGVCDVVQQRVAIELLISALGMARPTYIYPVFAPDHQHTVSNRNLFRRNRGKSERSLYPELYLYNELLNSTGWNDCLKELVIRLYESHRSDFTAMGATGRCHIALILRLLTVVADIDCNIVIKHLRAACKSREEEGNKFWGDSVAMSKDLLWLAPFVISFELGTFQIISMHKKTALWKEKVIDEEVYGNSAYRCDIDIIRNYSSLLSVLCSSSPTLCLKIGENSTTVAAAMLEALALKDKIIAQFIFRAATAVVHHAKVLPKGVKDHKAVTKLVPFDAPATNFRTMFIQEGNALDIACELLLTTYYDVWGFDSPKPVEKQKKDDIVVPGTVVPMTKNAAKVRDAITSSRELSGSLYEESSYDENGRMRPMLNEFNSSYHVPTIVEENSQNDVDNSVGEIVDLDRAENEKFKAEELDETVEKEGNLDGTDLPLAVNLMKDYPVNSKDEKKSSEDTAGVDSCAIEGVKSEEPITIVGSDEKDTSILDRSVTREGSLSDGNSSFLPAPPHNSSSVSINFESGIFTSAVVTEPSGLEKRDDDDDSQHSGSEKSGRSQLNDMDNDCKSTVDDVSTIGIMLINEWGLIAKDDLTLNAKSFALYTLECIIEMVESRLELQDRIYEKSPGVFVCLYNLLTPKKREDFDDTAASMVDGSGDIVSRPDDGTQTLTAVNAHMGLIGATAESIRVVVRRHPKIRELVRGSGCIEGLMDALDMSYSIDDKVLGIFVVSAVEQLIVRNIEAWNFVKRAAGMKGLLQLCHMGNNAVRILTTTEIISQITPKHDPNIYGITEAVLHHNGLKTILRMLKSPDSLVQSAALSLLEALCVNKLACRRAVMMPEFIAELGTLLFSSSLSVVRVACDVMTVLGAEDQFTLQNLVRSMDSHMVRPTDNPSYSKKSGKKHSSITGRLMDIANGMVSMQSCDDVAFEKRITSGTSTLKEHLYVTERLPPLSNSEPRLKQEITTVSNKAAAVMAALTDTEESNWPDGGAPLRNTLAKSGILPTINGRRTSDVNVMQFK